MHPAALQANAHASPEEEIHGGATGDGISIKANEQGIEGSKERNFTIRVYGQVPSPRDKHTAIAYEDKWDKEDGS